MGFAGRFDIALKPSPMPTKEQIEAQRGEGLEKYQKKVEALQAESAELEAQIAKQIEVLKTLKDEQTGLMAKANESFAEERKIMQDSKEALVARFSADTAALQEKEKVLDEALATTKEARTRYDNLVDSLSSREEAIAKDLAAVNQHQDFQDERETTLNTIESQQAARQAKLDQDAAELEKGLQNLATDQEVLKTSQNALSDAQNQLSEARAAFKIIQHDFDARVQSFKITQEERAAFEQEKAKVAQAYADFEPTKQSLKQKEGQLIALNETLSRKKAELDKRDKILKDAELAKATGGTDGG